MSPIRLSRRSFAAAAGLALTCFAAYARATVPAGVGAFQLRLTADSLVSAATAAGYHLEFRRETTLSFLPADSSGAEVSVELANGRAMMLRFTYPGGMGSEDVARIEGSLRAAWGPPVKSGDENGPHHVEWQDGWGRAVLDAPSDKLLKPMTLKLFDVEALSAAPDTAQPQKAAPAKKSKKPRHKKPAGSR